MLKRLRYMRYAIALTLLTVAIVCSGCAMNDRYAPVSSPGAGWGGGSC